MQHLTFDLGEALLGEEHFLTNLEGVGSLVSILTSNAIIIAGVIFTFLVIIAGYNMISGAGSNNPQKVARGREILTAAIIGFIIVFAAYWIVQLIGRITALDLLG